jgi:hypothetical protein
MALSFVNGKPKKIKEIEQPATLEEAMTPAAAAPDVQAAQKSLNAMFKKTEGELPFKLNVHAVGHVENPPIVDLDVSKTVAPEPSWPLDQPEPPLVKTFNPQTPAEPDDGQFVYNAGETQMGTPVSATLTWVNPALQEKLGNPQPFTGSIGGEAVDLVKLSEQQEPESEVSEEVASSEVLALVDEYTGLQQQIDAADISHLIKAQDVLKKSLQSIAKSKNYAANKPVRLMGTHTNYVEFSAPTNSTKIVDKPGLVAAIGLEQYVELTEITLANAKKVLPENVLGKYTTVVPGSRTLKTVHTGD